MAGVGVQGGLAACRGYTPLCVPGSTGSAPGSRPGIDPVADASLGAAVGGGPLAVQPDFYALLLVRRLEGGRWLPTTARGLGAVRADAVVMPAGSVRVALVNPDPRVAAAVTLRTPGARLAPATVLRLDGPSLGATSGVRLGGAAVAANGTWAPVASPLLAGGAVEIPAASAAVVTLASRC